MNFTEKLYKDMEAGIFKKVYLIYGDEEYIKADTKKQIKKLIVGDDESMNFNRFQGKEADVNQIMAIGSTFPFFAERRLIILENTGFFKKSCEELVEYLEQQPESTVILFIEEDIDKRGKLYKRVKDIGCVYEASHLNETELIDWIAGTIRANNKKMKKDTALLLLQYAGVDLMNLSNELNKLMSYTGDNEIITSEDVEKVCIPQISGKIFDLVDAIGNKNSVKAMSLYRDLILTKEPPMRILFMLARQFNIMLKVSELKNKNCGRDDIAKRIGVQSFVVSKALYQVERFSEKRIINALEDCISFEEDIKNGRLDELAAVEMLIIRYTK